jgi:hypothetical protein
MYNKVLVMRDVYTAEDEESLKEVAKVCVTPPLRSMPLEVNALQQNDPFSHPPPTTTPKTAAYKEMEHFLHKHTNDQTKAWLMLSGEAASAARKESSSLLKLKYLPPKPHILCSVDARRWL